MIVNSISNKVVLGTAQFGGDYGIANLAGKPTRSEINRILSYAWDSEVITYDSAPRYGSEEILGDFIHAHGIQKDIKVLTKIPPTGDTTNYRDNVLRSVEESLNLLGCPIEVLFFHDECDSIRLYQDSDFFKSLLNNFPIANLGISFYDPLETRKVSDCEFELAYQFPFNIFDKRFESAAKECKTSYARSVMLQGLLTSRGALKKHAPRELYELQNKYHAKLNKHNLDPLRVAISAVANEEYIDYFLIGVDTSEQLEEILSVKLYDPDRLMTFNDIRKNVDAKSIDPRLWN